MSIPGSERPLICLKAPGSPCAKDFLVRQNGLSRLKRDRGDPYERSHRDRGRRTESRMAHESRDLRAVCAAIFTILWFAVAALRNEMGLVAMAGWPWADDHRAPVRGSRWLRWLCRMVAQVIALIKAPRKQAFIIALGATLIAAFTLFRLGRDGRSGWQLCRRCTIFRPTGLIPIQYQRGHHGCAARTAAG